MRKGILFLIMILLPICCFSQTTLNPTKEQIKTANLISIEHEEMLHKIPLLEEKITNLETINKSWEHTDSIRIVNEQELIKKNKKLSKSTKVLSLTTILAVIWCLVK